MKKSTCVWYFLNLRGHAVPLHCPRDTISRGYSSVTRRVGLDSNDQRVGRLWNPHVFLSSKPVPELFSHQGYCHFHHLRRGLSPLKNQSTKTKTKSVVTVCYSCIECLCRTHQILFPWYTECRLMVVVLCSGTVWAV